MLIADRDGVLDLPVSLGANFKLPGNMGDGILFGALPAAANVVEAGRGSRIGCHAHGEPNGGVGRGGAGHATRHHAGDLRRRLASRQQKNRQQRRRPHTVHCNEPHRAVAGSADAHFQIVPSRQAAAV